MDTSSAVQWSPLIKLLAVVILALSGIIYAVWTVACSAKQCASDAIAKVERADEQSVNMKETMDGLRTDVQTGFNRVHERLDKFIGGE